jgi:hypothetical protein
MTSEAERRAFMRGWHAGTIDALRIADGYLSVAADLVASLRAMDLPGYADAADECDARLLAASEAIGAMRRGDGPARALELVLLDMAASAPDEAS